MSSLLRNILFACGLALILWFGYQYLKDSADLVRVEGVENTKVAREAQELLAKLRQVQAITISGALFEDPKFISLVDFRKQIVDEPIGRENPFLPIKIR